MRLALVLTRADAPGGAQAFVRDLAPALRDRGCEVTVLAGGHGPLAPALAGLGIPFRRLRWMGRPLHPFRDVAALLELRAVLRDLRPDLASLHSSKAGWLGRLACWSLGIPAVFTAHGWSFGDGVPRPARDLYRVLEAAAGRLPGKVLTVCEADRRLARERLGLECSTVPNGVLDDPGRADPGQDPPRLVMAARFCQQKDHGTLLRALARLRGRAWTLDLPGEGPGQEEVRREVERLGLAARVSFQGFVDGLAPVLHRAQVAVLCSRWEGLPLFILEAMRAGMPVVATAVGGVAEAVVPGETGFLAPPGGEGALAGALERLLDDPDLRRRLGRAGRVLYEERFRHEAMVERTLELYREAARRRG